MKSTILRYKIIAIASFLILLSVQFFLVYNTYKLKDEHFFVAEKSVINESYSKSIRNDKLYPGAQPVIDKYMGRNMNKLEQLYLHQPVNFNAFKQVLCDSIFTDLRAHSNMDSLFKTIVASHHLNTQLEFSLLLTNLSVTFSNNHYIPLYLPSIYNSRLDSSLQTQAGYLIDGNLANSTKLNEVTALTVSSSQDRSYQIGFGLHVDSPHRYIAILNLMKPTFALSFLSLLGVVLIYFYTFKNWLKQKKIADMKSDFVNSITHEFHTPLATIIIANKNLQNEKILERKENVQPLTNIIERQAHRLKTLFSRVLDITLMNESTLQKKEFVLDELMDEILLDYRLKLSDSNVEINFIKKTENTRVLLDKFWFTTMLLNIFENAIKYNTSPIKKIEVLILQRDGMAGIHIIDNGIGMSPQTLLHIFEKFYRSNTDDLKEVSGIGLGLFYARQCIEAHKWTMEVKSEEDKGSQFIIGMPVEK